MSLTDASGTTSSGPLVIRRMERIGIMALLSNLRFVSFLPLFQSDFNSLPSRLNFRSPR